MLQIAQEDGMPRKTPRKLYIPVDRRFTMGRASWWKGGMITEAFLKISEAARLTGVPAKTLRYYEGIGLISPAGRTASGYRLYGWRELEQVEFVRRAKLMGLSLDEIRGLVETAADGIPNAVFERLEVLLDHKLEETERKIEELRAFRESLLEYRGRAAEAEAQGACRCGEVGKGRFCGCVTEATDGVTPWGLRVVRENGRSVKVEENGSCRCGCCQPVSGEAT